jgi:acetoin utilization protein AcuB
MISRRDGAWWADERPVTTVQDYMTAAPAVVQPDEAVERARAVMLEAGVHHLPVLAGNRLVGLLGEPDLRVALPSEGTRLVKDVMVPLPLTVTHDANLVDVSREMLRARSSAAVVTQDADVVGVFTLTDALRALIDALAGVAPTGPPMPRDRPPRASRG